MLVVHLHGDICYVGNLDLFVEVFRVRDVFVDDSSVLVLEMDITGTLTTMKS